MKNTKTSEFLAEIRKNEGLKNAIISEIRVSEKYRTVDFYIITDRTYTAADEAAALSVAKKYVAEGARTTVKISKLVADESIVARKIYSFLKEKYPAVSSFITPADIHVSRSDVGASFSVDVAIGDKSLFDADAMLNAVSAELSKNFCGSFIGVVHAVKQAEDFVPDDDEEPPEQAIPIRVYPVGKYTEIDGGEKPKFAVYIADVPERPDGDLVVGGEIVDIRERATAAGKPFYVFTLSDCSSDKMRVTYFTKKKTVEKISKLKIGDKIVCRGDYSEYNGKLSYTAKYINEGGAAADYVPEERPRRKAPAAYRTVKPEPFSDYNQTYLYAKEVPDFIKNNVFVAYDLETTGLNSTGVGGAFDDIIEIGAVKIVGGEATEKFSSFVAPKKRLSAEIVNLTGITEEMLVGAPDVTDVIPDFYKFCEGCIMVGHNNISFDSKFISHYAAECDYEFTNRQYDTMDMTRKYLPFLSNAKLNTAADHYGIVFNHHRAFDDALASGKIFINIVTENGGDFK